MGELCYPKRNRRRADPDATCVQHLYRRDEAADDGNLGQQCTNQQVSRHGSRDGEPDDHECDRD